MNINIPKIKCLRCNYEWNPRKPTVLVCPRCKSAYWNTERKAPYLG